MTPVEAVPQTRSIRLPGTAASVPHLRAWVGEQLSDFGAGEAAGDARLVAGELAVNALRHTRSALTNGGYTVTLTLHPAWVSIEVTDDGGPTVPELRAIPADPFAALDTRGRGLVLVDGLAARWWTYPWAGGRITGARLDLAQRHG